MAQCDKRLPALCLVRPKFVFNPDKGILLLYGIINITYITKICKTNINNFKNFYNRPFCFKVRLAKLIRNLKKNILTDNYT